MLPAFSQRMQALRVYRGGLQRELKDHAMQCRSTCTASGRSSLLNPQGMSAAPLPRLKMRGTKAVSSHSTVHGLCEAASTAVLWYKEQLEEQW